MKVAAIVGGWYFPQKFYKDFIEIYPPNENWEIDYFVVCHRDPDGDREIIEKERDRRLESCPNLLDNELYKDIVSKNYLKELGYNVSIEPNLMGDYYFFNQWAEKNDHTKYDWFIFSHDDNYLHPSNFKWILADIFSGISTEFFYYKNEITKWSKVGELPILNRTRIDYIANSVVSGRKTARGSFNLWSKNLIQSMSAKFSMDGVQLTREGQVDSPSGHHSYSDWNMIGHNLSKHIERNGFMPRSYRLSKNYRVSKYMIEGERGYIGKANLMNNSFFESLKTFGYE